MSDLSERLAALTGPDRDVDREAWWVLLPDEAKKVFDGDRHVAAGIFMSGVGPLYYPLDTSRDAPRWTSDLNAVVAEIERRGWYWASGRDEYGPSARAWTSNARPRSGIVDAPTPCLALLRALVAAVEAGDG